mgnify:CR=1 FL=1
MALITKELLSEAKSAWKIMKEENLKDYIKCRNSNEPQYLGFVYIKDHWYYAKGLSVYDGNVYVATFEYSLLEETT